MNKLITKINETIKRFHGDIMTSIIYSPENSHLTERLNVKEFDYVREAYNKGYESYDTVQNYLKTKNINAESYNLTDHHATLDAELLKQKIDYYSNLKVGKHLFKTINEMTEMFSLTTDFSEAQKELKSLVDSLDIKTEIESVNLGKNYQEIIDRIAEEMRSEKSTSYRTHGFPTFNKITKGLKPENMIVISGAYKQGKTAFGTQLILDFGSQDIPVGIINLEMSQEELENRIVGIKAGVESWKIRDPKSLSDKELMEIGRNYSIKMMGKNIYLDSRSLDEYDLEDLIGEWVKRYGVKIICIDYISLIMPSKRYKDREERISNYSRMIKNLAKKHKLVIIVLAQLNRSGLDDADSKNMAESIAMARDADFIFTSQNPHSREIKSGTINGETYTFEPSDYIIKLTESRHSPSNQKFLIRMDEYGALKEIEDKYEL